MYNQSRPATMHGIQVDTSSLNSTSTQNRQMGRTYENQTPTTNNSSRPRISFYHKDKPYYEFANFSPHPVYYNGKRYPTSEHLFQSFKFQKQYPTIAEIIRTCSEKPREAFSLARQYKSYIRPDWHSIKIAKMDEALWHKFDQHPDLKAQLLATGNAELVEDSDKDAFWGIGPNGDGQNRLGEALERLRARLQKNSASVSNTPATPVTSHSFQYPPSHHASATNQLCSYCHSMPKRDGHQYCSYTCGKAAKSMCKHCGVNPRNPGYDYCSRTCGQQDLCNYCGTKPKRYGFDYCSRDCGREELALAADPGVRAAPANLTGGQRRYSSVLGF